MLLICRLSFVLRAFDESRKNNLAYAVSFFPRADGNEHIISMETEFSLPGLAKKWGRQVYLGNMMGKLRLQRNPSCPVEHLAIPGQEHSNIYKSFISIVYLKTKPQISSRGFPALNCFHQALFKVKTLKLPGRAFLSFLCCFFFFYRGYRHHVQK